MGESTDEEEEIQGNENNGKKKLRSPFDPECYRDNELSKGGRAKGDGTVIQEMLENVTNLANVRCRVESFGSILKDFDDTKRRWVKEMGFEGLFSLVDSGLPRTLCYWLATRVDAERKVLETVDGSRFRISKVQVHWVFGLPLGQKPVPNKVKTGSMSEEAKYIEQQMNSGGGISATALAKIVIAPADDEANFKRAFLMLALNEVICPTTCHRFSKKLIPAATVYQNAKDYDWCSLLLDHLFLSVRRFALSFYRDGYAKGCGGCLMFLVVFYLDKLRREPIHWGVHPRIEVWSREEIRKAQIEDTRPSGDFGKIGCLDVAYGEPHPFEARDALPETLPTTTRETVNRGFYERPVVRRGRKRRSEACNLYQYKVNKLRKDTPCDQGRQFNSSWTENYGLHLNSLGASDDESHVSNSIAHPMLPSHTPIIENTYDNNSMPSDGAKSQTELMHGTVENESNVAGGSSSQVRPRALRMYKSLLLDYVLRKTGKQMDDFVMLQCEGRRATLSDIVSVASPSGSVDLNYVRVVSWLYMKVWTWESRWVDRSRKVMMDPSFADQVLGDVGDPASIVDRISSYTMMPLQGVKAATLNAVFIPVLDRDGGDHWWAVVFSVNRNEIRMMDPTGRSLESRQNALEKITNAVDCVLGTFDIFWKTGRSRSWRRVEVIYVCPCDRPSSGVMMLMSIKKFAERFRRRFLQGLKVDDRAWLICEDMMSEFNEARTAVQSLLEKNK